MVERTRDRALEPVYYSLFLYIMCEWIKDFARKQTIICVFIYLYLIMSVCKPCAASNVCFCHIIHQQWMNMPYTND